MTVEELRIGNLIGYPNYNNDGKLVPFYVRDIYQDDGKIALTNGVFMLPCSNIKMLKPIPLTEEWLLNFGFEKGNYKELNEKHFVKKSNTIKVIISGIGFWDIYTDYNPYQITFSTGLNIITDNKGINHVHQLQNLYWCLCGKELEIIT